MVWRNVVQSLIILSNIFILHFLNDMYILWYFIFQMDLTKLNNTCLTSHSGNTTSSLKDCPVDVPQPIFKASITTTQFGEAILLELNNNTSVFLPKRVTTTFKPHIDQFVGERYSVIYRGLKDLVSDLNPMITFKIIETLPRSA